jgi:hypothetical protein
MISIPFPVRFGVLLLVPVAFSVRAQTARGQMTPYSDFYRKQVQQPRTSPNVSASQYTYNRYYYRSPAVSPYTNLMRPGNETVNNYYQYVRPEQQRRATAPGGAAATTGGVRKFPVTPTPTSNPYLDRYYGGRQSMGLH